jgi:hypothetical protein
MPINFGFTSLPVSRYLITVTKTRIASPIRFIPIAFNLGFTKNTLTGQVDVVVPSPSSYMKTTDLYLGGLYNFKAVGDIAFSTNIMPINFGFSFHSIISIRTRRTTIVRFIPIAFNLLQKIR